jgi:hypothetical protein
MSGNLKIPACYLENPDTRSFSVNDLTHPGGRNDTFFLKRCD